MLAGPIDSQVRDRIVAESGGNPLALIEWQRLNPLELAGGFAVPWTTVSGQVEQRYVQQIEALPRATQQLLLLAAADPTGDAVLLWRAAQTLGVQSSAAASASSADLLQIDSRVHFRHPLVRSAAYAAATVDDRIAAHAALAAATDAVGDGERRAFHLAVAATGPDEDVATQLEQAAGQAQARAGIAAAAALLDRAVELTADRQRRIHRALAAAQTHLNAGSFERARALASEAEARAVDDLQRARVEQLRGQIDAAAKPGAEAPVRLLDAARRLETLDVRLARETHLQAWWAALLAGRFAAPGGSLIEVSNAARAAPRVADPRSCDLLLDGLATLIIEGRAAAAPRLRVAIDLYDTDQVSDDEWFRWGRSATTGAFALWDFNRWSELSTRHVERARKSGALTSLVLSLSLHAFGEAYRGDLESAAALVAEQHAAMEATGVRMASAGARLLTAYRGRSSDELTAAEDKVHMRGDGYTLEVAAYTNAVLYNGLGQYADAFVAAQELVSDEFAFLAPQALSELIEAAVRLHRTDLAADSMQRLSSQTVPGSDWAAGVEARGRALVSTGDAAEQAYAESITRLRRVRLHPELARSHLVYGEWLRRENRRVDARAELQTAYDMLTSIGMEAFAERCRHELLATGATVRRRTVESLDELTPQELEVARLARDGLTNAEIGARLFISVRTVEWHLRKVFTKFGISSRRDLKRVLPERVRMT